MSKVENSGFLPRVWFEEWDDDGYIEEFSTAKNRRYCLEYLSLEEARHHMKTAVEALAWIHAQAGDDPPADFSELVYRRTEEA